MHLSTSILQFRLQNKFYRNSKLAKLRANPNGELKLYYMNYLLTHL